ncbi:MAG: WYL domain-containing protein [Chthoniobacteraceae bacterium]|nr:WYL domain-containing protein [Chthoniobacteraceae bacterium]
MRLSPPNQDQTAAAPLQVTRSPLERMWRIHDEIDSGSFPNCRTLSEILEVSEKTVSRDIEFMRSRLDLPIAYHDKKFGYYYTEPVQTMPSLDVSEGELVSLLIAQGALQRYRGTPYEASLRSVCEKIAGAMRGRVSVNISDIASRIVFRGDSVLETHAEVFEGVALAVRESKVLNFEYKKLGSEQWEHRVLRPYHLACVKDMWYAIGFDEMREAVRTFALPRMRATHLQDKVFERPLDFSLKDHLEHSLGVFSVQDPPQTVRIRFSGWAAQFVRERKWHSSQRLYELEAGALEWEASLSSMIELERWVMGFGAHARVLAPADLVDRIRAALQATVAGYATAETGVALDFKVAEPNGTQA